MKSIKEIADSVNVSKTSIYNLIKKHNIPNFKQGGKTFLDESGISLVIGYYSTEQHQAIFDIITDTKTESESEAFQDDFQHSKPIENPHLISVLEKELERNHVIIQGLIQSNQTLSQALAMDKMNETAKLMIRDSMYSVNKKPVESEKPKGFFKRMFKKK